MTLKTKGENWYKGEYNPPVVPTKKAKAPPGKGSLPKPKSKPVNIDEQESLETEDLRDWGFDISESRHSSSPYFD
jgi:hypothetical protein